jgi:hypothetical protein
VLDAASGTAAAFIMGWYEGALGIGAETASDALERHPELAASDVDSYLNGVDDGRRGDRFRLDHEAGR